MDEEELFSQMEGKLGLKATIDQDADASLDEAYRKKFNLPPDEVLLKAYPCSRTHRTLKQIGFLYISQNYVCFSAKVFHYEVKEVMRFVDVKSLSDMSNQRIAIHTTKKSLVVKMKDPQNHNGAYDLIATIIAKPREAAAAVTTENTDSRKVATIKLEDQELPDSEAEAVGMEVGVSSSSNASSSHMASSSASSSSSRPSSSTTAASSSSSHASSSSSHGPSSASSSSSSAASSSAASSSSSSSAAAAASSSSSSEPKSRRRLGRSKKNKDLPEKVQDAAQELRRPDSESSSTSDNTTSKGKRAIIAGVTSARFDVVDQGENLNLQPADWALILKVPILFVQSNALGSSLLKFSLFSFSFFVW
jgi:GRAM domain